MSRIRYWIAAGMCAVLCLLMFSCATVPRSAELAPGVTKLEYKSAEDFEKVLGRSGSNFVEPTNRAPRKLVGQPVLFSKRPLYGEATLGTESKTTFIMVADESRGTGSGYDTFYIDANLNFDLRDDPKLTTKPRGPNSWTAFPMVELSVPYGDQRLPYHVCPMIFARPDYQGMRLCSAGYCEGTITIDGKPCRVVLLDSEMNGRFDDIYAEQGRGSDGSIYYKGDALLLDRDGDGIVKNDYYCSNEIYRLGTFLAFGKNLYTLNIDPTGRALTLAEADTPTGLIKCQVPGVAADLVSKAGAIKLNAPVIRVPAGQYRLAMCSFEAQTDLGAKWSICGRGIGKQKPLAIKEGKKAVLDIGPPLTASLTCEKQGDEYRLGLTITGKGGEAYSAGNFKKDGESAPAPRVKIVDSKGATVAEGQFEYG